MSRHHRIDYIEFEVHDLEESKKFYAEVFGWSFNDYGPTYAGIQSDDGGEVGGFEQTDEVSVGGPLIVLYSDDLEASMTAVIDAGGAITEDPFDFPGGRRFHFSDLSGHELAVWCEPDE